MNNRKHGLGKGLGALIPDDTETEESSSPISLSINLIKANDEQPRKRFDVDKIQQLAESIKEHGIIQPIVLQKEQDYYSIIAGERRWRAAKLAGLKEVPVIIMDISDKEVLEISLIENIQREDLNPIEEAIAYKRLMEEFQFTQEALSKRIGKSRSAVTNILRLLNLDDRVLQLLKEEALSEGQGRSLLPVEDKELQYKLAKQIIDDGLSVREIERLIISLGKTKRQKNHKEDNDIFCLDIKNKLESFFSTKVLITNKKDKGKIQIEYYSEEDLERILELLKLNS